MRTDRVPNEALLEAGLALMEQAGKPLEKVPTNSRAMMYRLRGRETVRVRTCNDHILVVLADSADEGARLNIEGTDFLLIVMPETPRTAGQIIGYLVPTLIAADAVRRTHAEWLASSPNTKGKNRTWNIWFDDESPKAGGFAKRWAQYRLTGSATTHPITASATPWGSARSGKLGEVIAAARQQIADAAGVPMDAVKITVQLD